MSLRGLLSPQGDPEHVTALDIPVSEQLDVVKNERRRRVIELLYSENGPLPLRIISEEIAGLECGPGYTSQERKRVYVGLYQHHCDVLAEVDAVAFERETGTIYPGETLDAFYERVELVRGWGLEEADRL